MSNDQEYRLKRQYFRGRREKSQRRWINPHETVNLEADFYDEYRGKVRDRINCTFIIYHTHKAETMRAISQKRKVVIEEIQPWETTFLSVCAIILRKASDNLKMRNLNEISRDETSLQKSFSFMHISKPVQKP